MRMRGTALIASLAVTVREPAVLSVTLKTCVPATSAALPGMVALVSEEVSTIRSVTLVDRFQLASTAFTVMLKGSAVVWATGVPDLPLALPGEADSPGARICSFVKAPGATAKVGLVSPGTDA